MNGPLPHYLLFCDGNFPTAGNGTSVGLSKSSGRWKFVLEHLESGEKLEASDRESDATPDRTALIAVLRGLEALEQPSRVTLITTSRYVFRGLQYGLTEWRANDYNWEHFGSVQPIRNADIWKRIDRTLSFHKVQCRWISQDQPDEVTKPNEEEKLLVDADASKRIDRIVHEENQSNEMAKASPTTIPAKRKTDKHSAVYKGSGEFVSRTFDAVRTSRTVTTNYVIAEVEKKDAPESELSTSPTNESQASSPYSRIDSPVPKEHDSPEPTASCPEPTGPPPPKFLRRLSTMRSCVWQSLLRLDEEIEGYFRCLLLMEPRPPRRDS